MAIRTRQVKNKRDSNGVLTGRPGTVYDVDIKYTAPDGAKKTYTKRGFATKRDASQRKQTVANYLNEWVESYASLFVRGREFHLSAGMFAPDHIPTAIPGVKAPAENTPPAKSRKEGGDHMAEEKNAPQVQGPAPTPAADEAGKERQRLRDIDAIAPLYDPELVHAAKYGENPCTAQELAYKAAVQAAEAAQGAGRAFMAAMAADSQAAAAVGAAPAPVENEPDEDSPQAAAAAAKADVAAFQKMKEVR